MKYDELGKFKVQTQTLERTFIDKVFAVCDYYLADRISEHSRHLYDIFKLYPLISLSDIGTLVPEVREVRQDSKVCYSAHDGENIGMLLTQIIDGGVYKYDYDHITKELLFEDDVSYGETMETLKLVRDSGVFG